jgi:hypothetical protein
VAPPASPPCRSRTRAPAGCRPLFRHALRAGRTENPALPQPVPVQPQARSRWPAGDSACRALLRPDVPGGWHLRQPPLDVERALYDSSGAPGIVADSTGATMGTVLAHRSPSPISAARSLLTPRPPFVEAAHYITRPALLQAAFVTVRPSPFLVSPSPTWSAITAGLSNQLAREHPGSGELLMRPHPVNVIRVRRARWTSWQQRASARGKTKYKLPVGGTLLELSKPRDLGAGGGADRATRSVPCVHKRCALGFRASARRRLQSAERAVPTP